MAAGPSSSNINQRDSHMLSQKFEMAICFTAKQLIWQLAEGKSMVRAWSLEGNVRYLTYHKSFSPLYRQIWPFSQAVKVQGTRPVTRFPGLAFPKPA